MNTTESSPAGEGSSCTIDGAKGVLRREGNYLVCKPSGSSADAARVPRTMDAREAQRIKDAAYEEMCQRTFNAWRTTP
jgi:hypothetical protein